MKTKRTAGFSDRPFEYLDTSVKGKELLADCDPKLYRILKCLVDGGRPTIADLEASHALPEDTIYFNELLDFGVMPANGKKALDGRLRCRSGWFRRALDALRATELVFFDPDNGLETPSMKRHTAKGPKHIWDDALRRFYDRDQSFIVYQHATRAKGGVEAAIGRRACELRGNLECKQIWALRWHRVQSRTYFLVPATEHVARG